MISRPDWMSDSLASLLRPWVQAFKYIRYGAVLPYLRLKDRYRLNDLDEIYPEDYFEKRSEPPFDSTANIVVDILNEKYNPNSVIDIGCAIGVYLYYFEDKDTNVVGFEGATKAIEMALVDGIQQVDLRDSPRATGMFDLVLCIEVAEHLHPKYADGLIDTIISAAHDESTIVFTAAPPGQPGTHHVHLQPRHFWIDKFENRGWSYQSKDSSITSIDIEESLDKPHIMSKNLMLFEKS